MLRVILINGVKRVGKDSFVKFFRERVGDSGSVHNISSIDGIREGLQLLGVNTLDKSDETRNILALVGDKAEADSSAKTQYVIRELYDIAKDYKLTEDVYVFVHVREPEMIDKLKGVISLLFKDCEVTTLLLRNHELEDQASKYAADDIEKINNYDYTYKYVSRTMQDLDAQSNTFLFCLQHFS